jgi:hypothetical protein
MHLVRSHMLFEEALGVPRDSPDGAAQCLVQRFAVELRQIELTQPVARRNLCRISRLVHRVDPPRIL